MNNQPKRISNKKGLKIKTTPLGLEQLESRLMNAVSGIEQNLQLLLSPGAMGSTQMVGSMNVQGVNSAPSVRMQPRLSVGTEVRAASAVINTLGSDDQGETGLSYTWTTISSPTGSSVSFSANGNNEAKKPTVSFNKAGTYTLGVTIRDAAGLQTVSQLTFNVVQTLARIDLATAQGTTIPSTVAQTVAGNALQLKVNGYDQFGDAMSNPPTVTFSRVTTPSGGSVVASGSRDATTLTFNRIGDFLVRARAGTVSTELRVSVTQVVTNIGIRNAANKFVPNGSTVESKAASQTWSAVALDQFGGVIENAPTINWSAPTSPSGYLPTIETTGNQAKVTFTGAGLHVLRAQFGNLSTSLQVNAQAVFARIDLLTPNSSRVDSNIPIEVNGTSQQLSVVVVDQFGNRMSSIPSLTWSTLLAPTKGTAKVEFNDGVATITFTRAGRFSLRVRSGTATTNFQFNVAQVLTSAVPVSSSGTVLSSSTPIQITGTNQLVNARALDQFGQPLQTQPRFQWSVVTAPTNSSTNFENVEIGSRVSFNRAGTYAIRATTGSVSTNISLVLNQRLTALRISGSTSVNVGANQQFTVSGEDQFGQPMAQQPSVTWTATGGTIQNGLYAAGRVVGSYSVSAKVESLTAKLDVAVVSAGPVDSLADTNIRSLVSTLYADSSISRAEMMQILRSAGTDGSVSANELNDLRAIVGSGSDFAMPSYVRELAKDVVNSNPANLKFKGQTAGNLSAGSSATLLNNLVDKWFIGADEPEISGAGLAYRTANGNLFNGTPSRANAKQGYLGDCYFIASVAAIADSGADAIRNMFIDNGDGTYTVRFYNGAADYVTVNRRLPSFSNGSLGYSGLGQSITSTATTLWIALAEKAYAQWNETGNAGRDGTNRYSAIEGGWMSNVNRQVLGYNSTNYSFATSSKQSLINAISANKAVTLGTNSNPGNGFVGGHAYIVTGYNASTDSFTAYNPWGNTHPGAVTWDQLKASCTHFVVSDSGGTSPISVASVRSSESQTLLGNWSTVITSLNSGDITTAVENHDPVSSMEAAFDAVTYELNQDDIDRVPGEFKAVRDNESGKESSAELADLHSMAIDLAMTLEHLDSILS